MERLTNNLSTFKALFLVKGILNMLLALFFLAYIGFGSIMSNIIAGETVNDPPPFDPAIIFYVIGAIGFVLALALGIITILASKYLGEERNHTFILVAAIINCLTGILGILLGIFTIIELSKPHVKELFYKQKTF